MIVSMPNPRIVMKDIKEDHLAVNFFGGLPANHTLTAVSLKTNRFRTFRGTLRYCKIKARTLCKDARYKYCYFVIQ